MTRRNNTIVKNKADLRKPELLTEKDIASQVNETSTSVENVFSVLRQVEPISLLEFFVNPHSFSQSVENLFHLSFLIRDGKVAITKDARNGDLMLRTASPASISDAENGDASNVQYLPEFHMKLWKDIVDGLNLRESIIPHREAIANVGSRWYG